MIAIFSIARLRAETGDKYWGKAVKSARQLAHTVLGKAWEDTSSIFRQIDNIGPKAIAKLGSQGVQSECDLHGRAELMEALEQLLNTEAGQLESWLNRHHPYGMEVHRGAEALPRYQGTAL